VDPTMFPTDGVHPGFFLFRPDFQRGTRTRRSPLLVRGPGNPDGVRTRANKKPRARFRGRGLDPFQGSV